MHSFTCAEDGVDAVEAFDGGASAAGGALVARGKGGVHEVVAAGALEEVAAGGGHVAELRGGSAEKRLREERVVGADDLVVGEVAVADAGADGGGVAGGGDLSEVEVGDVDEGGGVLDVVLHQVDEVGSAAEELRSAGGDGVDGFVGGGGALVVEGIHARGSFRCGADGGDDVGVGSAAADVAAHALADLVVGEFGVGGVAGLEGDGAEGVVLVLFEEGDGGADLAGGAVAALEAVVFEEGGLDGVEGVAVGEAFDGGDLGSVGGDGEGEAGVDAAAVDEDGAGSALAVVAAFLAAGEFEVFAQGVEEGGAGVEGERVRCAVDLEGHGRQSAEWWRLRPGRLRPRRDAGCRWRRRR